MFLNLFRSKKKKQPTPAPEQDVQPIPDPTLAEASQEVIDAEENFNAIRSRRVVDATGTVTAGGQEEKEQEALRRFRDSLIDVLDLYAHDVLREFEHEHLLRSMFRFGWDAREWCRTWDVMEEECDYGWLSRVTGSFRMALESEGDGGLLPRELSPCDIGVAPGVLTPQEKTRVAAMLSNVYTAYLSISDHPLYEPPSFRKHRGWNGAEEGEVREWYTIQKVYQKDAWLQFRARGRGYGTGAGGTYQNTWDAFYRLICRDSVS